VPAAGPTVALLPCAAALECADKEISARGPITPSPEIPMEAAKTEWLEATEVFSDATMGRRIPIMCASRGCSNCTITAVPRNAGQAQAN
jgi:hypothetical protein